MGDNTAVNIDSARLQVIKARQEMESPEDKMDTTLHLIVKEHGADKRESFVENNDSADGNDELVMPPENTNESKPIGQYAFLVTPAFYVIFMETNNSNKYVLIRISIYFTSERA